MATTSGEGNKLKRTDVSIEDFLAGIESPRRRADATELVRVLSDVTGEPAEVWTYGIVGFGSHHYRYASGREGDTGTIGFAPRKANLVLYGFNTAPGAEDLLPKLGKHRAGASCLYVNKLADIDMGVLRELAALGHRHMSATDAGFLPR